jgi:hypothetical protein
MAQLTKRGGAIAPGPRRSLGGGGGGVVRGGPVNVARRGGARSGGLSRPHQTTAGAQRILSPPFLSQ